jgi:hypothetical protein
MSDSKPPTSPRPTLKLKSAPRAPQKERRPEPVSPSPEQKSGKLKAGARWSDEHTERMQAEMDALAAKRR